MLPGKCHNTILNTAIISYNIIPLFIYKSSAIKKDEYYYKKGGIKNSIDISLVTLMVRSRNFRYFHEVFLENSSSIIFQECSWIFLQRFIMRLMLNLFLISRFGCCKLTKLLFNLKRKKKKLCANMNKV